MVGVIIVVAAVLLLAAPRPADGVQTFTCAPPTPLVLSPLNTAEDVEIFGVSNCAVRVGPGVMARSIRFMDSLISGAATTIDITDVVCEGDSVSCIFFIGAVSNIGSISVARVRYAVRTEPLTSIGSALMYTMREFSGMRRLAVADNSMTVESGSTILGIQTGLYLVLLQAVSNVASISVTNNSLVTSSTILSGTLTLTTFYAVSLDSSVPSSTVEVAGNRVEAMQGITARGGVDVCILVTIGRVQYRSGGSLNVSSNTVLLRAFVVRTTTSAGSTR